ncbi:subtilase family protein [Actinomadura pelletieri DSM 43383]|uniref:Subtilase family protein n=1 Tax=Actinomadura pelletieri DSM 43383 TaxID=1120940 RepID=A0A495QGT0_9ACTN|nr:S8 family serine peptidase [Actinomadura pelletieri]RKS71126.1 subtilase family protein [Actinomadura pelletieri DSM 43383]
MLRRSRKAVSSALAMLVLGAVALPGSAAAAPNPLPQEWWFKTWGVQSHLWRITKGDGVTVAVIDTGVEAGLPELEGAVLPGLNAEDGRGDGRQDLDQFNSPPGHGTAMASFIVGQGKGTGMMGIAPEAKVLPVVAQGHPAYVKGIRFAADQGVQVINMSQGLPGPCPPALQESIAYALGKDAVIVASAGNTGHAGNPTTAPANCAGVLSVGAVDLNFRPWEKTQRQSYVKVAGPGVHTTALLRDGKLHAGSGTSDAGALVSGAVALIRAKHPDMKNREVVRQIIASALDIGEKGKDDLTGYGIIRPYRPLAGKAPGGTANPVFDEFDRWRKTHEPQESKSATPAASKEDDSSSSFIVWIAVLVVLGAGAGLFVFFFSRRSRGGPPPMGPGSGFGAPQAFGQQPPGGQGGPYPPVPPQGAPPHYQPHPPAPPGQHPPGQWPPGGAPPARP